MRRVLVLVGVVVLLVAGFAEGVRAQPAPSARAERLLVTFRPGTPAVASGRAHAAAKAEVKRDIRRFRTAVVEVTDVDAAIAAYRARGDVLAVERDGVVRALDVPDDGGYGQQWNLHPAGPANPASLNWEPLYKKVGAPLGSGVKVAVVDSGIQQGPDGPAIAAGGYDFVRGDAVPDDEFGHGTHVAATIAQTTGNPGDTSYAGVAPGAQIIPLKVLDQDGFGSPSNVLAAIDHALRNGAQVINLSLGGATGPVALCNAVEVASRSAVVVAASGNEASNGLLPVGFPAACRGAIAVGGVAANGARAAYSNGSCELGVVAPGGDAGARIWQSAWLPEHGFTTVGAYGTSMASAHVAGAAAVLLAQNPDAAAVRRALLAGTRDLGRPGPDDLFGTGALDLVAAQAALGSGAVPRDALGYWMVASDGGIFAFGDAPFYGSTGHIRLNSPIVGMARTPSGDGYWMVAADGGVFAFGDARFFGSAVGFAGSPVVGITATPSGKGYWMVTRDGGVLAFGDAPFLGHAAGLPLKAPIVGLATTRWGGGYWLVASDGGIFAFGDAAYYGSTGAMRLNQPIVGIARTASAQGYWLVAADGGIFAFGDAGFFGSTGSIRLNRPIVGMMPTCYGTGYWLVASDGGVFSFGDAPFLGSTGHIRLNQPVVGMLVSIDHRASQG